MTGIVKFFNHTKGYGFIKAEDGQEYFTHITGLKSMDIQQDDRVEFNVVEGKKGPNAVDVTKT